VNVKKVSEEHGVLKLLVKGADITFLNSLRRSAMAHVPVLAIEDVSIYKNDSVMFDEMLASRIALVPLKTDPKSYKHGDKTKVYLDVEGPKIVYSGDLQCADPKVEPVYKEIPLVKLAEGQRIKLEMVAVAGTGKEHAKWQPANVSYAQLPKVKALTTNPKELKKIVESCPKNVLEIKANKLVLKDPIECDLCGKCRDVAEGKLELKYSDNEFVLIVESFGNMSNKDVLLAAIQALKEKAKDFKKTVEEQL
jgi:DNA-directed RNA polymerase subunit D